MAIRFFDMFAGIGGFRSGLEAIGGFECVGYCEIDKYADRSYRAIFNTEGEWFCNDAKKSYLNSYPISIFFWAGSPANRSASQEQEKDLMTQEERCFSRLLELLPLKNLSISS